ncbi:cytochrome o ubiquinol oxidase subunit IV [Alteromonas macleodii]|jgi:cytochrome o ubiquinol oxidase operon protein cyoD|uniref:Cytochrome bo(3) ubiquinol oxidase subunit 4 n=1 Tax=Alteromonas macleodii (strain English Channel 673) TaxID=1004788 RepID=A0AB33A418_ALTME|nr:cytochrome o ubiquinol oxidase subunit IV [Alteromonas macleodii]MEC7081874.1 cytochrome o ubiquinol oxidase subunit IV [Pseudomonadota bacterium]AFT76409.1 cytochrome o ubiquinol oxidase protein (Ubiquinol oxidase chain D) [Alteromonas macleodii str. 'English Channel 673']MBL3810468.1 cytochrome o ubiquinol oxidase subunit IV [Alteromonas macleodii]MBL3884005.1 cytochrome o ubiquinol oxidase subunit IV [Alteromonas macleodii]MCS5578624.1 cytochrome o ubiquinol oxidase subunit IV [Alteromon|tara:strand:- start:156 stop:527 length:372 start_codon:yes stop_codon:yes gene_type:complete
MALHDAKLASNTDGHASSTHNRDDAHGDVKSYIIGFILSVVLTAIPFTLVMNGDLSKVTTIWSVVTLGLVQIWVHLKYFLHLNFVTEEGRANTFSFLFSALIIFMVVGLSVWIIYESNAMMMY